MGASSSSAAGPTFGGPYDVGSRSGLTSLYNERVVSVDSVTRPLNGFNREFGGIGTLKGHHAGVRVTTESGGQYLIQKGPNFGLSGGNTVVTDARYMSDKWTTRKTNPANSGVTVSDFVKKGGTDYDFVLNNCQRAVKDMEKLTNKQ
jgi:hypothetical protein